MAPHDNLDDDPFARGEQHYSSFSSFVDAVSSSIESMAKTMKGNPATSIATASPLWDGSATIPGGSAVTVTSPLPTESDLFNPSTSPYYASSPSVTGQEDRTPTVTTHESGPWDEQTPVPVTGSDNPNAAAASSEFSSNPSSEPWGGGLNGNKPTGPSDDPIPKSRIIAAVVLSLLFLALGSALVFLCLRRRRRRRRQEKSLLPQMKMLATEDSTPRTSYKSPLPIAPSAIAPAAPAPPVILTSVMMGAGYYTGIDTSDQVSVVPSNGGSNDVPYGDSLEEPPPPYRPRSVQPASRQSSLRQAYPATLSETHLIAHQSHQPEDPRSPFVDPPDDDVLSEVSAVPPGHFEGHDDQMSAVSDLSYQEEPMTIHQTV